MLPSVLRNSAMTELCDKSNHVHTAALLGVLTGSGLRKVFSDRGSWFSRSLRPYRQTAEGRDSQEVPHNNALPAAVKIVSLLSSTQNQQHLCNATLTLTWIERGFLF